MAKTGKWPRRPAVDMIAFGGKDAATIYLDEFRKAWERQPKLLEQLLHAYEAHLSQAPKKDPP